MTTSPFKRVAPILAAIAKLPRVARGLYYWLKGGRKTQFLQAYRAGFCDRCEHKSMTACLVPGTGPCCAICTCSLKLKQPSPGEHCPLNKW